MTPFLSIIIPIYKIKESYLRECLDSLLAQDMRDFQIIAVDDGSPDQSGDICDEYAQKDERVIVIHQENAGVSVARNAGIYNKRIFGDSKIESCGCDDLGR